MTRPQDKVFKALLGCPDLVRRLFEKDYYPAPWMGWVPMLCMICRDLPKASEEKGDTGPSE
jgi:hypothetical protein